MKTFLSILLGIAISGCLYAQDLNEGYLRIQPNKPLYSLGDSIHFIIEDTSGLLPDGTLIHVSWLNELGDILDNAVYEMNNEKACGSFHNKYIKKGPAVLRAYFTSNGKPMHIARSFIRIATNGEGYDMNIPEDGKPVFINRSFLFADSKLVKYYLIKEPFPSENIQYQITDKAGQIHEIAKAERVNDSIIKVPDIDLQDHGTIRFFLNNKTQYQPYDIVKIRSYSINEGSKWQNDMIIKNIMPFFVAQERKLNKGNDNTNMVSLFSETDLPNVTVTTKTKNRLQELEEKYTQSAFFKNQFGMSFDMLTDPSAANSFTVEEFLNRKVPGLRVFNNPGGNMPFMVYRMGTVELIVDEMPGNFMPPIWDIAYIKFIKSSLRGLNISPAGFLSRGSTGVQATLAIYTKKGDEANELKSTYLKSVSLPLLGVNATHSCDVAVLNK